MISLGSGSGKPGDPRKIFGCLLVGVAVFVLQLLGNISLDWFGPGKESNIFAYHPSFPDALNFQAQRQKFLFQACRLSEGEYQKFRLQELTPPSWENMPSLWLGAILMLATFPNNQVLSVANAFTHAALIGLVAWHVWGFVTSARKACACIFLLPSFYLWASQLLRDPFLWLVFWIFLLSSQNLLTAPKSNTWAMAGALVFLTGAWIAEEKRPLIIILLVAAMGNSVFGLGKTWKKFALVLVVFFAGFAGFQQMWAKGLSWMLFPMAALQDPSTREIKSRQAEAGLMPWQNIRTQPPENIIVIPDEKILPAGKTVDEFKEFISLIGTTLSGRVSWANREIRTVLDREGWVWLCWPAIDFMSLGWILREWFKGGPAWPRLHAMTFPLLCAGLSLCILLHNEHLGNITRNLAWFFLALVFTLGGRPESAQTLNRS